MDWLRLRHQIAGPRGSLDMYGVTVPDGLRDDAAYALPSQGLKQLHEDGNAKGVQPSMSDELRKLLFALALTISTK